MALDLSVEISVAAAEATAALQAFGKSIQALEGMGAQAGRGISEGLRKVKPELDALAKQATSVRTQVVQSLAIDFQVTQVKALVAAAEAAAKLTEKINALNKPLKDLKEAGAAAGKGISDGMTRAKPAVDRMGNDLRQLRNQIAGFFAAGFAFGQLRSLAAAADAMTNFNAKLRLATQSQEEFRVAQSGVVAIANQFGQSLEITGTAFFRVAQAVRDLGGGVKESLALTEALGASLRISGATSQEAAASMIQFAQAMGSGTLQGEELRSVLEGNRRLAKALADGLGVTVGALRGIAAAGKLTSQEVATAILSQLGTLRAEAELVPDTIERAAVRIKNAFQLWISASDGVGSSQRQVIDLLNTVAANIDTVVKVVEGAAAIIVGAIAGRMTVAFLGLAKQIGIAIAAVRAWQGAAAIAATAAAGTAVATGTAAAAFAALVTPIGLVVGAITALIVAYQLFKDKSADATKSADENAKTYLQTLKDQVEKQEELNRLTEQGGEKAAVGLSANTKEFARLAKTAQEIRAKINEPSDIDPVLGTQTTTKSESALRVELVKIEAQMERLVDLNERAKKADFFQSAEAKAKALSAAAKVASEEFDKLTKGLQTDDEEIKKIRKAGKEGFIRQDIIEEQVRRVRAKGKKTDPTTDQEEGLRRAQIQASEKVELDAIARKQRALDVSFERGLFNAARYYERKAVLDDQAIGVEIEGLRKVRAEQERILAKPTSTKSDVIKAKTDIVKIDNEILLLEKKQGDIAPAAARATAKAHLEVVSALEQVRIKLKEVTGTVSIDELRAQAVAQKNQLINSLAGDKPAQLKVIELANVEAAQQQLQNFEREHAAIMERIRLAEEGVNIDLNAGNLSQLNAQKELSRIRREQIPELEAIEAKILDLVRANASAFGPEARNAVEQLIQSLKKLKGETSEAAKELKAAFQQPLAGFFEDIIKGTKSASDAFKDFANAVVDSLVRIAAQKAAEGILDSIGKTMTQSGSSGSGSGSNTGQTISLLTKFASFFGFAKGGMVKGAGSETSDSIPARLSRNEFVLKAKAVRAVGAQTLYKLNNEDPKLIKALRNALRFSGGGMAKLPAKVSAKSVEEEEDPKLLKALRNALRPRLAGGGMVKGGGTDTSDSVPAWYSRDEFVLKAKAVRAIGPNVLYKLNDLNPKLVQALRNAASGMGNVVRSISTAPHTQRLGFATGGMMNIPQGGPSQKGQQPIVNFIVQSPDIAGFNRSKTQVMQDLGRAIRASGNK